MIVNLLIIRFIIPLDYDWVYYFFYIWVSLYGIFIISQYWLFANYIFNAAQSKRLFGLLNIGAISGAIGGSELSNILINIFEFKTESLIYFCIVALFIALSLVHKIYKSQKIDSSDQLVSKSSADTEPAEVIYEPFSKLFKSIYQSKFQIILVLIVGITMVASTIIDFQFKTIAVESYTNRSDLTSFMGRFYGRLSLAALILQVFLSHIVIRIGGIGAAVIARPISLIFTTIFLIANPMLLSASIMRGVDGSMRYSIDKTGRELLFMALPQRIKKRTKIFIDVFVDRFARGFAGLMLLLLVVVLEFSVEQLGYFVAGIIGIWLILAWAARLEYVNQFRKSLLRHQIRADRYDLQVHDHVTLDLIRETLRNGNDSQIIYALNLLEEPVSANMAECLLPLLKNSNEQIRLKALTLLNNIKNRQYLEHVAPLLRDSSIDVRLEAILYFCSHSDSSAPEVMGNFLDASNIEIKSSALACMGRHSNNGKLDHINEDMIKDLLEYTGEDRPIIHAQTAIALGNTKLELAQKYLPQMLKDDAHIVVREAILAMGQQQDENFIPYLIDMLDQPNNSTYAVKALKEFGTDIIETLEQTITDQRLTTEKRKHCFRVLAGLPCQHTVDRTISLLQKLENEPELTLQGIKTLNDLRTNFEDKLMFDEDKIDKLLHNQLRYYYHLLSIYRVVESDDHGEQRLLLIRALDEEMEHTLERIFRIVGLEYPPDDIYGAYLGIRSISSEIRAEAIEFLDNLLSNELKTYLFPIIDPRSSQNALEVGNEFYDLPVSSYEEGLLQLLEGQDMWLKTCAVYFVSPRCPSVLRDKVETFISHKNNLLRETAQLVMQQHADAVG